MTSCPAGPQPRPSFWQRRWPRTSCTLMQALGQAFCSWWAARWVRGLFFSRSFSTFVASSQGASVLKWPVSFFFYCPFSAPTSPESCGSRALGGLSASHQLLPQPWCRNRDLGGTAPSREARSTCTKTQAPSLQLCSLASVLAPRMLALPMSLGFLPQACCSALFDFRAF